MILKSLSPIPLCLGALMLVGCQSSKSGTSTTPQGSPSGPPDAGEPAGQDRTAEQGEVVRIVRDVPPPRDADGNTRYITTLGLPAAMWGAPPDWIVNPALDGVLGSVGVAPRNDLGTREQLGEARVDGRIELARMLETRIQGVGRGDLEQYLQVLRSGEAYGHENNSRKSNLGVDRTITDLVLSGSRQRAMWFDPTNGDCYVWLVMDGGIPGMADHSVENGVSVYVANRVIDSEYRPDWPSEPEAPAPAPLPQPAPAPAPVKSPTEKLEEALKPIETIPVGGSDEDGE